MKHLSRLLILSLSFLIASCASTALQQTEPVTHRFSENELPWDVGFRAYSHRPLSLQFVPERGETPTLQDHVLSILFLGVKNRTIAQLSFRERECSPFLSYSLNRMTREGIDMQYFDDALPSMKNLNVSSYKGKDSDGKTRRFIKVNDNALPLEGNDSIREVKVLLDYPLTIVTKNLSARE